MQGALVFGIEGGGQGADLIFGPGLLGQYPIILEARDARLDGLGKVGWTIGLAQQTAQQCETVAGVDDTECRSVAEAGQLAPQNRQTQTMKGGHQQPAPGSPLQTLGDARLHLPRRLVGKGDGGNVTRRHLLLLDEMHNFLGNDARFTGASAGKDEQRSVHMAHRLPLRGVELETTQPRPPPLPARRRDRQRNRRGRPTK